MTADRAAHQAARELLVRRMAHINGTGPKPTDEEVRSVEALRVKAARLYKHAMDEIEEITVRAESASKRNT